MVLLIFRVLGLNYIDLHHYALPCNHLDLLRFAWFELISWIITNLITLTLSGLDLPWIAKARLPFPWFEVV